MAKEREGNKSFEFTVERFVESPQLLRIDRFKFEKRKRKFNLGYIPPQLAANEMPCANE